jgi:hypothetical protein
MTKLFLFGALVVGTPFVLSTHAAAQGMDIAKYCQAILGSSATTGTYSLNQPDSWYCQAGGINRTVDLSAVCQLEYGVNAYPVLSGTNPTPAYDWLCVKK